MRRLRRTAWIALPVAATLFGCCGLPLYLLNHLRMQNRPELLYPYYESRLQDYGRRLEAGDVNFVQGRGYAIPQYLIDHGARYCTKQDDCFCISFGALLDNPTPELWYSPRGFDPMPEHLARLNSNSPHLRWMPLTPQWTACYR